MVNPRLIAVNHFRNQGLKGASHQIESVVRLVAQHVAYGLVGTSVVFVNTYALNP